jgi:hypothetical protein
MASDNNDTSLSLALGSIEQRLSTQVNVAALMASSSSATQPKKRTSLDHRSILSDSAAHLYRFGHEVQKYDGVDHMLAKARSMPSSIASLGQPSVTSTMTPRTSALEQSSIHSTTSSLTTPVHTDLGHNIPSSASVISDLDNIMTPSLIKQTNAGIISGKPLRVVSGAQFRLLSHHKPSNCEHCEHFERLHRKDKETVRSLKLQIMRLDESFKELKYNSNKIDRSELNSAPQQQSLHEEQQQPTQLLSLHKDPRTMHKLQQQSEELDKCRRLLQAERNTTEALRQGLEDQRHRYAADTQRLQREVDRLGGDVLQMRSTSQKLQSELEQRTAQGKECERELQTSQRALQDAMLRLQAAQEGMHSSGAADLDALRELQMVRKQLSEAQDSIRRLERALSQKAVQLAQAEEQQQAATQLLRGVEQSRDKLQLEVDEAQSALKLSQEQCALSKKRLDALEATLKLAILERDALKAESSEQQRSLQAMQTRAEAAEAELLALQQCLSDTQRRLSLESGNARKALEKAISASVRLCVVAPTVNVNVGEQRSKLRSKLNENALRDFLDKEVFCKYAFLFKQDSENASPNGSEQGSMETWLKRMLAQMQSTIEAHVNSAMEGSSL